MIFSIPLTLPFVSHCQHLLDPLTLLSVIVSILKTPPPPPLVADIICEKLKFLVLYIVLQSSTTAQY